MSPERHERPTPFVFTEREALFDTVTDERFMAFLQDEQTVIHSANMSSNTFGEFMFVTMSRSVEEAKQAVTFWGLGFHDYRERWIASNWNWYETRLWRELAEVSLPKDEVIQLLEERRKEIAPYVNQTQQSRQGMLFELLADMTDEDGALSDLEDFGDWLGGEE
jgi:hypothetical protein